MTLYREQLVDAVVLALIAANTIAGSSIYADRDWPLSEPQLPSILVKAPAERKESLVRGAPQFNTTATITVLARVSGVTSQAVAKLLALICRQIEKAVLSSGSPVQMMVQQFTSVDTETRQTSVGEKPLGDALLSIACEFYEEFPPCGGVPLNQVGFEITQAGDDAPVILSGSNIAAPGAEINFQP